MNNRRSRVNRMLRGPATTRRLKRNPGRRYLVKPSHLRFSNTTNVSNNNNLSNYSNNNINHLKALIESRKSIVPSRPYHQNIGLTPNQAILFANLSANYNDPRSMINALTRKNISNKNRNILRQKVYALYN